MPKYVNKILLIFSCIFLAAAGAKAQQKIGYVNTDQILSKIPAYKGIKQKLSKTGNQWHRQINEMQQHIDTLQKEFQAKKILFTKKLRAQKRQKIETLIKSKQQFIEQKFGTNGDYFKKQKQLLQPIQRKVYQAITKVAQQNDIDFIFDRAQNSTLLYGQPQWNLNNDVLQALGITLTNQTNQ